MKSEFISPPITMYNVTDYCPRTDYYKKLEIITHYCADDVDCSGDYCMITIKLNDIEVTTFGDHYHDKGWDKTEGFIAAAKQFNPNIDIIHTKISDYRC
jgi:hypothetical protein